MWMAERGRASQCGTGDCAVDIGVVTLSQEPLGVYLDGERRQLPIYSPAGYSWRPKVSDTVLVVKTGEDGDGTFVIGVPQESRDLATGEVCLFSQGGAEVRLTAGGEVCLRGDIVVNGQTLEAMIRRIVAEQMRPL